MLRVAVQRMRPAARQVRALATSASTEQCGADARKWEQVTGKDYSSFDPHNVEKLKTDKGALIVYNTAYSLEWVLTSPPPLHAFLEPPIIVEWPEGEDVGHH